VAVSDSLKRQFERHIDAGEAILATANSNAILGDEVERYCLTASRLGILRKPGLFKWVYADVPIEEMSSAIIDEGVFKSHIVIKKADYSELRLLNLDNADAPEFFAALKKAIYRLDE
jgi:hypothetical protein